MVKVAADGDDGLIVAMIDQADLLVDDGQLDDAVAIYDKVLKRSKDHPLAVSAVRSVAPSHRSTPPTRSAISASSFPSTSMARASTRIATSRCRSAQFYQEDYKKAAERCRARLEGQATPGEPRFWARVVWAQLARGDIGEAGNEVAEPDPLDRQGPEERRG